MGNHHGKERRIYSRKIDWENAEKPSPPGKPYLVPDGDEQESDVITIRWAPPVSDGGAPILGYVVEHRRTGSPHWLRAIPYLTADTKLTLTGLEPGWRYQFRVTAENGIGRSPPGEISEVLTVTSQRTAATSPHFNVELRDTIALENEKVEFTVHVVAVPQAKISWYKDGFEVFSSRRMKIVTENDQSTFIIHQAALEDEGEIKCTATNRAGHSVTKAILKLEAPPRIRLPRQYEDGLLFERGELIRLKVTTAGRPPPSVTWYHNGEMLQNNEKYEITDADRSSSLRISEAHREDRGEYQIRGTNKIGEDVVSFLVTVTDRPLPPGKATVTMALGRSVTLSWTSPEDDGGCKIGSYIVEYYRVGWNMWLKAATCRNLSTDLTDLIEGSEYKFRIKAENPYGMSDPSEESEIIFIPDPKRGILAPPPRKAAEMDAWLDRVEVRTQDDVNDMKLMNEKRKILEENARKLLDTPLPVLLSQENTIVKPPRKALTPSPSTIPEVGKRTHEEDENIPPPVPKRRHKQRSTPSPSQPMDVDTSKENVPANEMAKNEKEELLPSPREEDHTMFHGSSELMLVLLPDETSKSHELSIQQRSEIESLIGEGVAPPMSLSAPELGSDGPIELPLMREAVSSSELLYERAMARLYQDAVEEESQKLVKRRFSGDRKSIERRSSLRESTIERRHSFKENIPTEKKVEILEIKSRIPVKTDHAAKELSPASNKSMIPIRKKSPERMSSVEKEQMEFAIIRERIRIKNEQNLQPRETPRQPVIHEQQQHSMSSMSSQMSSYGDEEEEIEEEEESYLEEENEEEEILANDEDIDSLQDRSKILPKKITTPTGRTAPFAEQEDDICLPLTSRIVLPRIDITLPPVEEQTLKEEKSSPPRSPEPEQLQEMPSKIPIKKEKKRAVKILKKLGLKREKKIPEIVEDSSAPSSPLPKPILKNKPVNKKKDKESRKNETSRDLSTSCDDASDDGLSRKKKQVRITEPSEDLPQEDYEEEQGSKVLIYHYSDIVREFGQGKKSTPKQCLSCEELKAAVVEEPIVRSSTVESIPSVGSDTEVRGSPIDMSDLDVSVASSVNVEGEEEAVADATTKDISADVPKPEVSPSVQRSIDYITDVAMFIIACCLYLFKNELYALPVLFLMAYKQLSVAAKEKHAKLKAWIAKRFSKGEAEENK